MGAIYCSAGENVDVGMDSALLGSRTIVRSYHGGRAWVSLGWALITGTSGRMSATGICRGE